MLKDKTSAAKASKLETKK